MATEIEVTVSPQVEVITVEVPGIQGIKGDKGDKGNPGDSNVLTIGDVTTGAAGSSASATISGATPNQILNLTIPRGNTGATGPANTLAVGTINTGAPGSSVVATITGTAPNQTLNLTIPRGDVGPANSLSIGTVSNGTPGATGSATITGTAPTQTLNLTLPVPATTGTSTTSTTVATGSKTFTTQAGIAFVVGQYVRVASTATPTTYMGGPITAYTGTSLTVNVLETSGSGTLASWNIAASGNVGSVGPAPTISTTSTTSLTIGAGSKVFTTAAPLNLAVGQAVKAWDQANASNYMVGLITALSGTSLTINVTEAGGTGTIAAWNIALGAFKGAGLPTGGTTGQLLYKLDATDFNVFWLNSDTTASGNSVVLRDGTGNGSFAKVTLTNLTPSANGDVTSKSYVDGKTWASTAISDSTTTGRAVLTAASAAAARTAIGAGTSDLAIGTTSTTAKAGDYQPTAANISDSTATGRSVLTAASAAAARTAIGAGTGNGNVTGTGITSIVQITQAAYTALGTKDSNTLYVIVG